MYLQNRSIRFTYLKNTNLYIENANFMNKKINEFAGKNIRMLRLFHNYKQADLALKLGINRKTLSNYENHNVEVPTQILEAVSKLFLVDIKQLLTSNLNLAV